MSQVSIGRDVEGRARPGEGDRDGEKDGGIGKCTIAEWDVYIYKCQRLVHTDWIFGRLFRMEVRRTFLKRQVENTREGAEREVCEIEVKIFATPCA